MMWQRWLQTCSKGFIRIAAIVFLAAVFAMPVMADEKTNTPETGVLSDSVWEYLFESEAVTGGIVQSICITDQYIITIENAGDNPELADVVTAYYKYDHDKEGNPVNRFSLAKRVHEEEWEHGNGMCWNPVTNEIYVTLYTNTIEENRGCIYVMDPDTLMHKRTIKVSDDFNLTAITYDNANDRYFVQTDADWEYSILILDSKFQIVENFGPEPADPGYNFQDFCMVGDHLLQFPLTWNMGIGEYMMAYSISQRAVSDTIQLFFDELPNEKHIEPESIGWLDDESFIVPVNATAFDDSRRCLFYRVTLPHLLAPVSSGTSTEEKIGVRTVSAVSSTSVDEIPSDVNVTKGNQELSRTETQPEKKKFPIWIVILLLMLVAFAIAAVLYIQYVRQERAKREARMRKKRRVMMAQMKNEQENSTEETERIEELEAFLRSYVATAEKKNAAKLKESEPENESHEDPAS